MIYKLPEIESKQIEKAHMDRMYRVERDRLKTRYFIYLNYPKINYHGLNLSEAKKYVYADFIARYQRLIGRNVLFSIGYNNNDSSIYLSSQKFDKPLYSYVASTFQIYQKELKLLDISYDKEKEVLFSSEEYIKYVQDVFLYFYEKDIITLKHDNIVYSDKKIYQKGEYYEEGGKCFSFKGEELKKASRNYYALKISSIKKDIKKDIESLPISSNAKLLLLDRLCYRKELEINCQTTTDEQLKIKMENPEFICGISYIAINPNYIDIKPFIIENECGELEEFLSNVSKNFIYSGTDLINPIINNKIPIFISTSFDEAIHVGIPSLSDMEENIVNQYELDFNPVFDFINDECVLVNSGRFNGMAMLEAHQMVSEYLIEEGIATEVKELKLDELIISSNLKFGVPVPIHLDNSHATLPVLYSLRHEVKLEAGDLAEKTLVKEFLNDDFVNYLLPNAIRLKSDAGILDFRSFEALSEIGLFRSADLMVSTNEEYINELLWMLVFNHLFSRYYTDGFDCPVKDVLLVKPILDDKLLKMHRENNNLVSINSLISSYGSSVVRLYYAASGVKGDNTIFNIEDILELNEVIDSIVKVFYYPIDEMCVELDISYQKMVDRANMSAKANDFSEYFDCVLAFIKKVHETKHISRTQARGLLIILSVLTPSLAEQIKQDVLNLKEPLYFYSWPE